MVHEIIVQLVLYHDGHYLSGLIESLKAQSFKNFHVVALDNSSDDTAAKKFKALWPDGELFRTGKNLGYAGGHSFLIERTLHSGAPFVVVLNTDVQLHPDFLSELYARMKNNHELDACGPLILEGKGASKSNIVQNYRLFMDFTRARKFSPDAGKCFNGDEELPFFAQTDYLSGVAFMIRTRVLRDISFFDPTLFMYGEERDFFYRFSKLGCKAGVLRNAVCWHFHDWSSQSKEGYRREYYYLKRNKVLYFKKYRLSGGLISFLIKELVSLPFTAFWMFRKGGLKMLKFYVLALWHGLKGRSGQGPL